VVLVLRRELIRRVAATNLHLRASDVEKVVLIVFEEIIAAMARGDRVELRGIGSFSVRARQGRSGRNPRSGAKVTVPDKRFPHFRPGKPMHERLNGASVE
jgi:integration host factor subunit beta